jgi:hypothetical protein
MIKTFLGLVQSRGRFWNLVAERMRYQPYPLNKKNGEERIPPLSRKNYCTDSLEIDPENYLDHAPTHIIRG